MTERLPTNKAEAMEYIAHSWDELNEALDSLTEEQATGIKDENGWTVKDHIIHMTAWERGVVYFLSGRPRHEGIGVPEQLYRNGNDDDINAEIRSQRHETPLHEAREQFRETHQQTMQLLDPLPEEELSKPYRHFLPDEPGEGEGPLAYGVILGNTAGHFKEHLEWIKTLVSNS